MTNPEMLSATKRLTPHATRRRRGRTRIAPRARRCLAAAAHRDPTVRTGRCLRGNLMAAFRAVDQRHLAPSFRRHRFHRTLNRSRPANWPTCDRPIPPTRSASTGLATRRTLRLAAQAAGHPRRSTASPAPAPIPIHTHRHLHPRCSSAISYDSADPALILRAARRSLIAARHFSACACRTSFSGNHWASVE